jgi:hypothetical protein
MCGRRTWREEGGRLLPPGACSWFHPSQLHIKNIKQAGAAGTEGGGGGGKVGCSARTWRRGGVECWRWSRRPRHLAAAQHHAAAQSSKGSETNQVS